MIMMAIDHYAGQMSEVARRPGIGRSTLYRKLEEYGIDPETGRSDRLASWVGMSGISLSVRPVFSASL
jgi:DNA-binding phage protein